MPALRQIFALTASAIRGIPQRLGASLVTVVGITTVMTVLVSLLALGQGVSYLAGDGVRPDRAVVFSRAAQSVGQGSMPRSVFGNIAELPGVKRDAKGVPIASAILFDGIDSITKKNQHSYVTLFAASPQFRQIFPELRIVAGRWFTPGLHELVVSDSVRIRFKGFNLGDRVKLRGTAWTIVGAVVTRGFFDSAAVVDLDTMMSAFSRPTVSAVDVLLDSPASYAAFKKAVADDPTLEAQVQTEEQGNRQAVAELKGLLDFISYFVGGIMAIGAVCGALASLYAAVDARRREIATLRAIGFGPGPVVVSVLAESLTLALPSALLGAGIAWFLFNGHQVAAVGLTFPLTITLHSLQISIFWSLAIALLGGFLPAIRAARMPVATALRAV